MKLGRIAAAYEVRSLSRLRGRRRPPAAAVLWTKNADAQHRLWVGVSPRVIVWREPPPGSHLRCDPTSPASGRGAASLPPDLFNQPHHALRFEVTSGTSAC